MVFLEPTSASPELLRRLHVVADEIQKGITPLSYPELEEEVRNYLEKGAESSKVAPSIETTNGRDRVTKNPYPNKKIKLLVILVGFSDRPMGAQVREEVNRKLFTDPERSAAAYYREVSGGKVELDGHIIGPVQLTQPVARYMADNYGRDGSPSGGKVLISDAAKMALSEIKTFAPFCHRSKSADIVDGFVVIHSAAPAERDDGSPRELWSSRVDTASEGVVVDPQGYKIKSGCLFSASSPLGVVVHELGHLLFGFPDLYAPPPIVFAGAGRWCLMGTGNWLGGWWNSSGTHPGHPCAWMKINQGWITPTDVRNPSSMSLVDIKEKGNVVRLFPEGDPGCKEYFIIEHRRKRSFDSDLPGEGLLIWHIDESQYNNGNPDTPFISLMQADGLDDLRTALNQGDETDPYTGTNNTKFGINTNPNSSSVLGTPTNIVVSHIERDPQDSKAIRFRVKIKKDLFPSSGFQAASPIDGSLELHGCDTQGRHFWVSSDKRHQWSDRQHFDFDGGLLLKKDVVPALVCREEGVLDLFVVGKDGRIHTAWKPDGSWHGWGSFAELPLSAQASITVHSRHKDHMTLLAHGDDGRIYESVWDGSRPTYWSPWQPLFADIFSSSTPITSLTEYESNRAFVFAAKADGSIWCSQSVEGAWKLWERLPGDKKLSAGGRITAFQRQPERIDVYIITESGDCCLQLCENGRWTGIWQKIGTASFAPTSFIAATLKEGQVNLFVVGQDNRLAATWWKGDSWNDWYVPNGSLNRLVPGSHLAIVSPRESEMVVIGRTLDEYLHACTWEQGGWESWEVV